MKNDGRATFLSGEKSNTQRAQWQTDRPAYPTLSWIQFISVYMVTSESGLDVRHLLYLNKCGISTIHSHEEAHVVVQTITLVYKYKESVACLFTKICSNPDLLQGPLSVNW